jgi:hypothetical protein
MVDYLEGAFKPHRNGPIQSRAHLFQQRYPGSMDGFFADMGLGLAQRRRDADDSFPAATVANAKP